MKNGFLQLIVLIPKDLLQIPGYNGRGKNFIYREYERIRKFAKKERPQRITFGDLCNFLKVTEEELINCFSHLKG